MIRLTPREREIVILVGHDLESYRATARRLGIEVSTVRSHVYNVVKRIGSRRPARTAIIELARTI